MKKILAVLAVICLVSSLSFARASEDMEFIIKTGVQPQGTWSDGEGDENTDVGVSAGVEYFKYFINIVAIGGGINYDLPREFKEDSMNGKISFLPFYTAVKVRMPLRGLENNYPFVTAKLGYSAFINDMDWIKTSSGGLYAGISAGYCIGALFFEAGYFINNLSYKPKPPYNDSKSFDATYSTIAVYIGVKMD
ncbi:MAG: porin family protein [Endomicrobium sp.]|nr:porin family protein [Endomicrobium sp.]